jgi:hypothetical protein
MVMNFLHFKSSWDESSTIVEWVDWMKEMNPNERSDLQIKGLVPPNQPLWANSS